MKTQKEIDESLARVGNRLVSVPEHLSRDAANRFDELIQGVAAFAVQLMMIAIETKDVDGASRGIYNLFAMFAAEVIRSDREARGDNDHALPKI